MKCTRTAYLSAGLLLAVLTAACASAPRYSLEVEGDRVRAPTPEVAADAAELLVEGRALLARQMVDLSDTSVEVWVQAPSADGALAQVGVDHTTSAFTRFRSGKRPRIYLSIHEYRDTFVHELTHALLGPGWRTLALAPEEGLCTLLNDELADPAMMVAHLRCAARAGDSTKYSLSFRVQGPAGEAAKYSTFWGNSGGSDATESTLTVAEILALSDSADLKTKTQAEIGHVYGVGVVVVSRILALRGIEGLHELCLRAAYQGHAQVPVPWLLDAAGIESDAQFEQIALAQLRAACLAAAFESESFERLIQRAQQEAGTTSAQDVDEFLERFEGTLRASGTTYDLRELPEFHAWLREASD